MFRGVRAIKLMLPLTASLFVLGLAAGAGVEGMGIVCANSLLADLTQNIVGDLVAIEYIMPAGACPAHFDSRPSDVNLVAFADVIVQIGWEGWLNKLVESSGNTDVLRIRTADLGEWNLPHGAKAHVDAIAEALVEFFPEHASRFTANAAAYKEEIDAKGAELLTQVESEDVVGRKVVCMEWLREFVELLGFDVVAVYGPPESLSVGQSLNITAAASEKDVCMIIDNLQSGTDFGSRVASETGVSHVILTNFPKAIPNADTYLEMIEYNAGKLIEGAQMYEYRSGEIAGLESTVEDLRFQRSLYLSTTIVFLLLALFSTVLFIRARS
jgi:ABC-type Zn uptake system ZnuABC Zn-binding protein ZnuA